MQFKSPFTFLLIFSISPISIYFFFSRIDLQSQISSLFFHVYPSSCTRCLPPLRVYMYNLDRRFNFDMIDNGMINQTDQAESLEVPPWPRQSGIKRQHSVEYWLMASLLLQGVGEEMEAIRVADPGAAEAFYVPFFSSISFNVHGHNMTDPATEGDRILQNDLLDILRNSKYYQRSGGRDHDGIVRLKMAKMFQDQKGVCFENSIASEEGIRASIQGMRSSKFCLHPAGDTPSSCRLFDAIVSHCVPVIVSDQIELPFEDEIDYHVFSLFFSVEEALRPGYLLNQLQQFPKERWLEMWKALKHVSHHYEFQYPPKKDDAVNMLWRQVRNKLPLVRLDVHRNRRLKIPDWWNRR